MASLLSRAARSTARQWALLSLGLLFFAAFFAYQSYNNYKKVKADESKRLLHQARVIDLAVSNEIREAAIVLRDIRTLIPDWNRQPNGRALANETLKRMERALLGVRTLLILDANGDVFATNRDEIPRRNFRERDYFQYPLRTQNDDILFVSPPFVGALDVFVMNLSIPVFDADRRFQGVVAASLDVEHFNMALDSVRHHDRVRVLLSHGDGKLFAMRPAREGVVGADLGAPGSFFSRHLATGERETVLEGVDVINKDERIVASRTIIPHNLRMSHPLVVTVSHDSRAILRHWRKDTFRHAVTLALLATAVYVTFYFYHQAQRRFARDRIDLLNESNKSKERLLTVFDNHQDGFVICDADGRVIALNRAYQKINPLAKDAVAQCLTFEDILRLDAPGITEAQGRIEEYVRQRLLDHGAANATPIIRQLGDRWYMIRDIRTPGGEVITVLTDVTELKNTQDTLRRSERALAEKTERLLLADKAKDRFLAIMSHELRTPLSAILGFAQLLAKEPSGFPPETRRGFANDILSSGQHLLSLINDMLDITQIEAGKRNLVLTTLSAADVWKFPLNSISVQIAEKRLTLKAHIPETPIRFNADRRAVHQCLLNVLGNAVKFTPPGGVVTCRTEVADGRVLFIVEDTGIGISPEDIGRLGRPFEQIGDPYKAETKGTGLGLAISFRLTEMMGGKLEIASELGRGTRVTIAFPCEPGLPAATQTGAA
jgi:signal transduction histidine kinase